MRRLGLAEIKKEMIALLKEIKEKCEEHGLRYFLGCGTLLGAVRHNGFIPWDDDVDILMPRSDYNKLIELQKNGLLKNTLCCNELNKKYKYSFAKYSKDGTYVKEFALNAGKFGICIDIFPLDGVGNTKEEAQQILKKAKPYAMLQWVGLLNFWLKLVTILVPPAFIIALSHRLILKKLNKIAQKKTFEESAFVGVVVEWAKDSKPRIIYEGITPLLFEGEDYAAPAGFREWLEQEYGENYMTPPPENKRKTHVFRAYQIDEKKGRLKNGWRKKKCAVESGPRNHHKHR